MGHDCSRASCGSAQRFTIQQFHFGEFTLDQSRYRLQRGDRVLRLEKIPMELLILLVAARGDLVSREEIAAHLWGKDVFLDVDHSINVAVRKIRVALRDDPEKPRFVETVVGKGYRFAAPVVCGDDVSNAQAQPASVAVAAAPELSDKNASGGELPAPKDRFASSNAKVLLAVAVALVCAVLAFVLYRGRNARNARQPAITSLAVLPLKNLSGDPSQEYLADGLTEALIGRLSGIHDLRVISRTSAVHFKDSHLTVPEIAKTLQVDAIVEGSVIRDGNRIRVQAQLIRADTDAHLWSATYDRELEHVLALESDVAQSIAGKVEVTLSGEEQERLVKARSVSPDVYENYLKGRFALENSTGKADTEKSIDYFQRTIQEDPTFAPGYVGLASAYQDLSTGFVGGGSPEEVRLKTTEAARKALELDPQSVEAHDILADMERVEWRWADAEAEYRRALELNPHSAAAQLGLAEWLAGQGQADEALARAQRARELDPPAISGDEIGWILFQTPRYTEALREYRIVLAVKPNDAGTLWHLGFALLANGQPQEAIPVLEKLLSVSNRSPGVIGVLIRAYAQAGRRRDALRLLAELRRREQEGYVPAAAFVNAYLGLGENEQAFAWLEQAYKEHSNILLFLKVHPFFDPLRSDPRSDDLARRVGLG